MRAAVKITDGSNKTDPVKPNAKSKKKARLAKTAFERRFVPASPTDYMIPPAKNVTDPEFQQTLVQTPLTAVDGSLPDNFAAHLRMFVSVWESGLDGMTDDAVRLLNLAIRDYIKNILTAVITFKSTHRSRDHGKFKYAFGAPTLNPYLKARSKSTALPIADDDEGDQVNDVLVTKAIAEQEAMYDVACSTTSTKRSADEPVNLWHLYHALKLFRNCIPSHTVYAINLERVLANLWHDDPDSDGSET